ncbi:MAG: hypothetical protein J7J98_04900 [candidate division Zixibacteria bacterium]|nr:hypothetical protein [candidate division Zixibacteria bacterium]
MTKKLLLMASLVILVSLMVALPCHAMRGTKADINDAARSYQIDRFNLTGEYEFVGKVGPVPQSTRIPRTNPLRRTVGTATSPDAGIGVGVSIDLTFDDMQYGFPIGRYISHYWNGEIGTSAQAGVHFVYESVIDTVDGDPHASPILTGYNVYDAAVTSNNWPRGQDGGCDLQSTDEFGYGKWANMAVLGNTNVVIAATSRFFSSLGDDFIGDNMFYFQGAPFNCVYDPRSGINTTFIDTTVYRVHFGTPDDGHYSEQPEITTQFDGANTITHAILAESEPVYGPASNDYVTGNAYLIFTYYRKVGDASGDGSWSSGVVLDSIMQVYSTNGVTLAASPVSGKVCISYSNPGYYGNLLNNEYDTDVFYKESTDYGLTWNPKVNVTTYQNAIGGDPNHFKAWVESPALYDSNDDLHIIWTGTGTSADPYFDGFNWNDFDTDIFHWSRNTGNIIRMARGTYLNDDYLTGSINTLHCGFGGQYSGYIAFIWISECDGKLYIVWNQMQEWVNHGDYTIQPELMEDCAVRVERIAAANWEVMMSVAQMSTPDLWDPARSISATHTPRCGLAEWDDSEGPCGNEYKPAVEAYALDETGLSLTWPVDAVVDLTPEGEPPYDGGWYLNLEYMDDQIPGGFVQDTRGGNEYGLFNSEKWVRLACVEPVEASLIDARPSSIIWPEWVELGQANAIQATVTNEGNVTLNVTEIGFVETSGSGWLSVSESPTPTVPFQVTAGVNNTANFNININASGLSTNTWLDGEIWLLSDAFNKDSLSIPIHVLAAVEVEPVLWDTVMTHANMFDVYFPPEGECVALAVGNSGDLGWGAGSSGLVNLDYVEAETECGERDRDGYYLMGSTAFTILADASDGTNAMLTQSTNDANQGDATGWDPIGTKGSITGGLGTGGNGNDYDSVYTGVFVNRDTTIAMERTVYGPRSADPTNDIINFVIVNTKVYSGDGAAHNHVTIGNVCDWDVPADEVPENMSGKNSSFVYMQGTDTVGSVNCQPNVNRYATEAFGGGYTSAEWQANDCVNGSDYFGFKAYNQLLMEDTTNTRGGVPLNPSQPMVDLWWDSVLVSGLNAKEPAGEESDQAIWFTYVHDYDLGATDTLNYWTVLTTVRNGTLSDLEAQVSYAKVWYTETIRGCSAGCCVGRVGDANGSGVDEPTIGDVSVMIDAKFITGSCAGILECLDESDINQSGPPNAATCADVTIGDISILIDYLFITGPSLGLNACF